MIFRPFRTGLIAACIVPFLRPQIADCQELVDSALVAQIKHEAMANSRVLSTAFMLTDVYGPRLTGSPSFRKAGTWAIEQLRGYGLSNVRADLIPWGRGWSIEDFSIQLTQPQFAPLIGTPVPWSPSTNGDVAGDVILLPLPKWKGPSDPLGDIFFTSQHGRLRGKILLANVPEPLRELENAATFTWSDSALNARLARGDARAASEEQVPPTWMAVQQNRELRAWQNRLNRFLREEGVRALIYESYYGRGGMVFEGVDGLRTQPGWLGEVSSSELPPPTVVLAPEHYLRLTRLLNENRKVRIRLRLNSRFHTDPNSAFNVIADLPGNERRDEVVLLGAHLDSWTGGTGATDDAAGAAVIMEAMRILRELNAKPARTIRAALWGGHEGAGTGSRSYIAHHLFTGLSTNYLDNTRERVAAAKPRRERDLLTAYFNLDFGGGRIRGLYLMKDERLRPIFSAWLAPFADMNAAHVSSQFPLGSDHFAFWESGIPAFPFIQEGTQWVHHSNMDTFDQLSENHLKQSAAIVAAIAYFTATRAEQLPRPVISCCPSGQAK